MNGQGQFYSFYNTLELLKNALHTKNTLEVVKILCLVKLDINCASIRVGKVRIVTKGGKKIFCHQNIENVLLIIKKE